MSLKWFLSSLRVAAHGNQSRYYKQYMPVCIERDTRFNNVDLNHYAVSLIEHDQEATSIAALVNTSF